MRNKNQNGSAVVIVLIVIVIALLGALGYVFWKNSTKDDTKKSDTSSSTQDATNNTKKDEAKTEPKYTDLRTNSKDGSGVSVKAADDVSKLTNIGDDLASYFKAHVGESVGVVGGTVAQSYIIDRLDGDYAVGQDASGMYTVWGPASGEGAIKAIASTQQLGFQCSELIAAKVPSQLVDSKCVDNNGSLIDYK